MDEDANLRNESAAEIVTAAWREVLNNPKVSHEDDFFTNGGDSLLALELVTRIETELRVQLPLTVFFTRGTLSSLISEVQSKF